MSGQPLDKMLKQYYGQQQLSSEAMARMVALADSVDQNRQQQQKANFWQRRWGEQRKLSLVASVMVALLLIPLLWPADEPLLTRVAKEVALNHNKQLASDYVTDSYQALAAVMDKLDFKPALPTRLKQVGYSMIGARYCSIQGGIAAQIKLASAEGEAVTLYQTQLNPALAALGEQSYMVGNIRVETWQEGEIFFSLASSSQANLAGITAKP